MVHARRTARKQVLHLRPQKRCKELAKEMEVPLLAQIPLVQSICESGDAGEPAACSSETATGLAFINFAQAVVTVVNRRNREQAPHTPRGGEGVETTRS